MALARITTQFPEYSISLARSLRSQGFEVHTCAPGDSTSKPADLEITLKPCAQEDRQSAMNHQPTDKDMFVLVSPGVDANKIRSIEMVVLRPRAELDAMRQAVTPAQVIVMSLASFQGNGSNTQRLMGQWEELQAKAAATWELTCALCWHLSKATRGQMQKIRAALKSSSDQARPKIMARAETGVDPELVPSMFGLSSEALGSGTSDFVSSEITPRSSWREPLVNFCLRRWGIVASAVAIGLASLVVPQLWHSNAASQPASSAQQADPIPAAATAALTASPTPASVKSPVDAAKPPRLVAKPEADNETEASFGDDVTVRHFPLAEPRGATHPTQTVSRRVVMN